MFSSTIFVASQPEPLWLQPYYVDVPVPVAQPTVYTSDILAGTLDWEDTPASIIASVRGVDEIDRGDMAARFLGRIPAGGWVAEYRGAVAEDGVIRLVFRGEEEDGFGRRVLVSLIPKADGPIPQVGQRVLLTGRLAEVCVDDPGEPAGRLLLADGAFR